MIKQFCDTFSKSASSINKDNMTVEMGFLILPLLTKYKEEIKTEWKIDISYPTEAEKAGEKFGQLAVLGCPAFMEYVKNNLSAITEDKSAAKVYSGRITSIGGAPFTYLMVKNKAGKTEKMYWLDYFEGAEGLSANPNGFLNKDLRIEYRETEVYDAPTKEYRTIKVVTKIS